MKPKRKRTRIQSAGLETLEPRQLLSAVFQNAIGWGTASSYGQSITGMAVDTNGDVVVAGYFSGTIDIDPTASVQNLTAAGQYDIYLMKYSAGGALLWAKSFGDIGNDMGAGVMIDPAGNILMTGSFSGTVDFDPGVGTTNLVSSGGSDAFVAKFDAAGNLLWADGFGGLGDDAGSKVISDNKGGYALSGTFQQTADLDPGTGVHMATAQTLWDVYVTRIDSTGNLIWANTFTAPSTFYLANIAAGNDGGISVAGSLRGAADFKPGAGTKMLGSDNALLGFAAKYNTQGKLVWAETFGDGTDGTFVYDMTLDPKGNMILAGSFGGSGDFNPGRAVKTLTEHQSPDAFTGYVMKLGKAGGFVWAGALTGTWWSDAFAVATDAGGNIYVTGENNDVTDFDITGTGSDTLPSKGQDDAYLVKYDAAGHFAWGENMGSDGYDHGLHVAVGPGGTVYAAGYFTSTAHFGPTSAGIDLTALGGQDSYIAVFGQTPAPVVVTATATVNSLSWMKPAILTATVAPAQGVPTGWVLFTDGTKILGRVRVDSTGHAVLKVRQMKLGQHAIIATYLGDDECAAGVSLAFPLTVT